MIEHFAEYGYLHLKNIVPKETIKTLWDFYNNTPYFDDPDDTPFRGPSNYRLENWDDLEKVDPIKSVDEEIQAIIEEHTGLELIATYNMGRVNTRGQKMQKHTDRVPCEISVTMPIAYSDWPWPICAHTSKGKKEFTLDVGDILIYKGCEIPHERNENRYSDITIQHYWHYIDKNSEVGAFCREFMEYPGWIGQNFMGNYESLVKTNNLPLPGEDFGRMYMEEMKKRAK